MRRRGGIETIGPTFLVLVAGVTLSQPSVAQTIRVDIGPGAEVNTFVPTETFGAGIDRMASAAVEKLFTKPAPTGSVTCANTIGMVLVAFCKAANDAVAEATSTSGPNCTSSAACARIRSALPFA